MSSSMRPNERYYARSGLHDVVVPSHECHFTRQSLSAYPFVPVGQLQQCIVCQAVLNTKW